MMNIEKAVEKVSNPELVKAIEEMREEFTPEKQNNVLNYALRATFLMPCVVMEDTQLVAEADNHVHFEDKPQVKFLLIQNQDKKTFFPAFTDSSELVKFISEQEYQPFGMKFTDLATLTEQNPSVDGFVVNPYSHNLPFTKELLADMKAALMNYRQKMEQEESKPDITVATNDKE